MNIVLKKIIKICKSHFCFSLYVFCVPNHIFLIKYLFYQSLHETSHGESISSTAEACLKLAPPSQILALGVNCCPPEYAASLLKDVSFACPNFPLIVYPNSGEKWSSQTG